jgi:type IV secretory pathway TraG/TraD family ATPase VirD4
MTTAILIALAGVLLTSGKWAFLPDLPHRRLPRNRVRYLRIRVHLRLHPGPGHASLAQLWLRWGRLAAFRRSRQARPSMSFWQRALGPASSYSIRVGRAHLRHALRLPLEEHAIVTSPPRAGKTGWLASVILRYPGPVLSTTTKHDVYQLTAAVRSRRGPLHVFNPQGIGGVPSTFSWNPLDGCQEPATAIRRADAFANSVSQKGVEDSSFWASKASDYLRAYFHAAATEGLDLRHVAQWVTGARAGEAEDILSNLPGTGRLWAGQLAEMRGESNKTVHTIRMTMSRTLGFLADPALAAAVLPGQSMPLDLETFLRQAGTLYLIAEPHGEDSPLAPLFACLASEIHYTAAILGSQMPGGRLDPPLLMALDEVTQICPVPVPSWLADSGGKGIQLITVAHGEAQLRTRWGRDGAQVIMDTSGAKIWLPGISDTDTLEAASTLCGSTAMKETRSLPVTRRDFYDVYNRHPVMAPEMIRQLPAGHALVVRGGHSPVIARLHMCWKDPLYRSVRHAPHTPIRTASLPVPLESWSPASEPDDDTGHPVPATAGNGRSSNTRYPWDEDGRSS